MVLSKSRVLEVIKIECNNAITMRKTNEFILGDPARTEIEVLDFEMLDNYFMLYCSQTIGFGNRIILQFFYMRTASSIVPTKQIDLNFIFSADKSEPRIFLLQDKNKIGASRAKYSNQPLFLIKVKINNIHENVLFIDPRAPMQETIPFTLLSMKSNVTKIRIGKSLFTNDAHTKSSVVVYYKYLSGVLMPGTKQNTGKTPKEVWSWSLMKLDEIDPNLRLTSLFE